MLAAALCISSMVARAVQTRDITLSKFPDSAHPDPSEPNTYLPEPQLKGLSYMDPVTIKAKLGTTEVWRCINLTADTHPMHEHDVMNRIVARIPFNASAYWRGQVNGRLKNLEAYFTGPPQPAKPNEDGWSGHGAVPTRLRDRDRPDVHRLRGHVRLSLPHPRA